MATSKGLCARSLYIIAPKSIPSAAINLSNITRIYLGSSSYIASKVVMPAIYCENTDKLEMIVEKGLNIKLDKYQSNWRRKLFSGSAIPPQKLKDQTEFEQFLDSHENSLIITFDKLDSNLEHNVIEINVDG